MKPWGNAHTVAVLWMLVGILLVAIVAGKVSEYQADKQWSQVTPAPVKHPTQKWCHRAYGAAWCP